MKANDPDAYVAIEDAMAQLAERRRRQGRRRRRRGIATAITAYVAAHPG